MLPFSNAGNLRGRGWPHGCGRHNWALGYGGRRAYLLLIEHTIGIIALLCRTIDFQRPSGIFVDEVRQCFQEGKEL
jgi:hypothetical protein